MEGKEPGILERAEGSTGALDLGAIRNVSIAICVKPEKDVYVSHAKYL